MRQSFYVRLTFLLLFLWHEDRDINALFSGDTAATPSDRFGLNISSRIVVILICNYQHHHHHHHHHHHYRHRHHHHHHLLINEETNVGHR